jgi:hypothetical protein
LSNKKAAFVDATITGAVAQGGSLRCIRLRALAILFPNHFPAQVLRKTIQVEFVHRVVKLFHQPAGHVVPACRLDSCGLKPVPRSEYAYERIIGPKRDLGRLGAGAVAAV